MVSNISRGKHGPQRLGRHRTTMFVMGTSRSSTQGPPLALYHQENEYWE